MYFLLGIDTILRIAAAMALLFVAVPALAMRRPASVDRLQWFWLCFATGTVALTLLGQLLTLVNAYSPLTLLLACAALIVIARGGWPVVQSAYRLTVVGTLNVLEGRVSLRRRRKRLARALALRTRDAFAAGSARWTAAAWALLVAVAAVLRFYRPFVTANLGFSDTYVHLYLVRLLEEGRQVDPAWGPYPRGMHFLLLAIHELTNANEILLMNFFGPFIGVLMVVAVADSARRLGRSLVAGLVAGLLFATLVGGASQYFLLGGSFAVDNAPEARRLDAQPYHELAATAGEFDIALTSFQRQSATLPQEVAIVFLFPAAVFLLQWLSRSPLSVGRSPLSVGRSPLSVGRSPLSVGRSPLSVGRSPLSVGEANKDNADQSTDNGQRTTANGQRITENEQRPTENGQRKTDNDQRTTNYAIAAFGYLACTAAIACTHPGVMVPHVVLSGLAVVAARVSFAQIRRVLALGALGTAIGSTWMIAFIAYPYTGGEARHAGGAAFYYFPLLRRFAGEAAPDLVKIVTWVSLTPALTLCVLLVLLLLARRNLQTTFVALAALTFFLMHVASRWRLPEIVEIRRNAEWFTVALCIAAGVGITSLPRRALMPALAALAIAWSLRVPDLTAAPLREKLINYSGYGETASAVLDIERRLEPFTWTLVTYGQEFPMVLGRGFHLAAPDFLDRYDPADALLRIPTRYVFIAVEKQPHPFQIDAWKSSFSRTNIESRLQTWCFLYGMSHRDLRVSFDDANVRVYEIRRPDNALAALVSERGTASGAREGTAAVRTLSLPPAARRPPLTPTTEKP